MIHRIWRDACDSACRGSALQAALQYRLSQEQAFEAGTEFAAPLARRFAAQWPGGLEIAVFDGIRKGVFDNRSAFYLDLAIPFFGMNREGAAVDEALRRSFWSQGMMGSVVGQYACIREFSEVDYTSDLEKIDVPTLVIHGDDDQIVPFAHAGALTAKVVRRATLKVYEGAPHGLAATHQDRLNADLLDFARS